MAWEPDAPISGEGLEPLKRGDDDEDAKDGGSGSGSDEGGPKEAPIKVALEADPKPTQDKKDSNVKAAPEEKPEKVEKPGTEDEELAKRFERLKNLR